MAQPPDRGGGTMTRKLAISVLLALASCNRVQNIDASRQVGPNPVLPKPVEELVAAVGVPKVVGWKQGEKPSVPAGFQIQGVATGLSNPRNILPLANGYLLVVETDRVGSEPVGRPKDPIRDFSMS